jgi:hypothetical protein
MRCRTHGSLFVILFSLMLLNPAQAQSTITIGETSVLTAGDSGNGNLLCSQNATLSQTATINSLSFYVTTAGGNLRLGIYDATGPGGGPGALKAQTNSFTAVKGWNTASVVTPVSLPAGTYWLAYLPSSNSLAFVKGETSGVKNEDYSYTFGSLPATFSTSPPYSDAYHWSFYATLTPAPVVNGACGSANGTDLTSAPTTNLCSAGTQSSVTGSGPWDWTCAGSNGGSTASCSANLEINGTCGSANGTDLTSAPTTNLCNAGTQSSVTGSGPWDWTCAGSNGGSTASCSANLEINGACGSSNGTDLTIAPTTNLCSAGTQSSVTGTGPWDWTCAGSNGGTTASCSAPLETTSTITIGDTNVESTGDSGNGNLLIAQEATLSEPATIESLSFYVTKASGNLILGLYDATGPNGGPGALKATTSGFAAKTGWNTASVTTPVLMQPGTYWIAYLPSSSSLDFVNNGGASGSFCYYSYTYGSLPSAFSTAPSCGTVNWSFYATLAPSTSPISGVCSSANGVAAATAPAADLCSAGTASAVGETGNSWTWSCAGFNGGSTASCAAPVAINGQCGSASGEITNVTPTSNLCNVGTASAVSGSGP